MQVKSNGMVQYKVGQRGTGQVAAVHYDVEGYQNQYLSSLNFNKQKGHIPTGLQAAPDCGPGQAVISDVVVADPLSQELDLSCSQYHTAFHKELTFRSGATLVQDQDSLVVSTPSGEKTKIENTQFDYRSGGLDQVGDTIIRSGGLTEVIHSDGRITVLHTSSEERPRVEADGVETILTQTRFEISQTGQLVGAGSLTHTAWEGFKENLKAELQPMGKVVAELQPNGTLVAELQPGKNLTVRPFVPPSALFPTPTLNAPIFMDNADFNSNISMGSD